MSPSLLKMAQEQSLLSLILGEKDVLVRVTPISSEIDENLFLNTSSRIGFTFMLSSFAGISHMALRLKELDVHGTVVRRDEGTINPVS
jgi:predicted CDP-diglyceride synthetase/phosphatidate cytidylyltransferase